MELAYGVPSAVSSALSLHSPTPYLPLRFTLQSPSATIRRVAVKKVNSWSVQFMKRLATTDRLLRAAILSALTLTVTPCLNLCAAPTDFTDANWISMGGIPGVNGAVYATALDGSAISSSEETSLSPEM